MFVRISCDKCGIRELYIKQHRGITIKLWNIFLDVRKIGLKLGDFSASKFYIPVLLFFIRLRYGYALSKKNF